MIKKYLFFVLMSLMPAMLMAQAAGGTIKRSAKKTQAITTTPAKKPTPTKKTTTQTRKQTVSTPKRSRDVVLSDLINNMVYVEGGTFTMGVTQRDNILADAVPAHQVSLSSFSIGRYEVTQEEWQAVMDNNPSQFKGARRPVENVSWDDCLAFIRKLKELTGKPFRLPTEAEWEYAARGGSQSRGYVYSGSNDINQVGWYWDNSGNETHPVGQKRPNELGLYDMSGNVSEWCQDWYGHYSSEAQTNPTGPSSGNGRTFRGNTYLDMAAFQKTQVRGSLPPSCQGGLGLRLAL